MTSILVDQPIQCLRFATYLENIFFVFFAKVSKYYDLNCYFLKVLIANMTLKKSEHILNLTILRFKMNEKAGFEIILKRCEHVTYVIKRTFSMN